jgi:hypothetical protein
MREIHRKARYYKRVIKSALIKSALIKSALLKARYS